MNATELAAHKEKIKQVMIDHLKATVGYPKCSPDQIMSQLKQMWVKLEEQGLVVEGMKFANFAEHAQQQYFMATIHNIMGI